MAKITLTNQETGKKETVNLILRFRKAIEFEKEHKDSNIIKTMSGNKGAPTFETMVQMLYIGYVGGLNKSRYTYDEFMDMIEFDFSDVMTAYSDMINKKKN